MTSKVPHLIEAAKFEKYMSQKHRFGTKPEPTPNFTEPLCAQIDSELFFAENNGGYPREAYTTCQMCIHRVECAEYATWFTDLMGMWGGLTEHARRRIRQAQNIIGTPTAKEHR